MKKNLLSLLVLISMLLALVSSASATTLPQTPSSQGVTQTQPDLVVVRVFFKDHDQLNELASRYDILTVDQAQGFALITIPRATIATLESAGFRVEVDEAKTRLINTQFTPLPGQGPDTIPGFPCYRTVEETFTSMQDIVTAHPDMADLFDIGDSWTRVHSGFPNGYDILALRLTNKNFGEVAKKPTFFLMAEIHAREYVTAETAMRYAEYLISNYGTNPDITWLLDYYRVYIVTMTNPDGRKKAEAGNWWRKNVDNDDGCSDPNNWGTDLNRNHSFKWNMGGSSGYACDETYHGPTAGSEPEVQAIETFVTSLFPDQRGPGDSDPAPADTTGVFITLHSYSELVLWPWGWTSAPAPNSTQLQTLGRHLAFFNGYNPQQSYQLYQTSGTSDEFAYGTLGIAGYTFEMGNTFFQDCASFESTIYPTNRDALLYAFKAARRPYMTPAGPDSLNASVTPSLVHSGDPVALTATANDTRYAGGEPTQNIAEAHYSIDAPSWITGTVTYPMTPVDGSFNSKVEDIQATIDTTGLSSGRHIIFVESKDVNNNWGVVSAAFLYTLQTGVSPVIQGYVREAGTNLPLTATVTAGMFSTSTDPATGFYSMDVISGTYDIVAAAANFAPSTVKDVLAQDYQTITQDFTLYPYCSIFSDDVENGNQGWTAQTPWGITTGSSHSPTHSWTDSPAGNYGNNLNISLTSQTFDFTGYSGVTLNFWQKYITQQNLDIASVEYNAGAGWVPVASFSGSQNSWQSQQLAIPGLDNQPSGQVRFHFTTNGSVFYDGWYVDDINLQGAGPGCKVAVSSVQLSKLTADPILPNTLVNFSADLLPDNADKPYTYSINFGDGTIADGSSSADPYLFDHTFAQAGRYTVQIQVMNAGMAVPVSSSLDVLVVVRTFLPSTYK